MTESRRALADKRVKHLADERARMDPLWMELRDAFLPHRGRFGMQDEKPFHQRIALLNETPMECAGILASGLHAGLTSPARPWQKSAIMDDDLSEYGPVKEWLAEVDRRMMVWYAKSNLYQALPFLYAEYGVFGTMCGLVIEDPKTLFRVEPYTVGQYSLARSERGEYDTLGREFTMTVRQLVGRFGEANVSAEVRRKWSDTSKREDRVSVIHLVEPDGDGFASCYYEKANKEGEREGLLRKAAFAENPILAASWEYVGNEPYACGCPGMKGRGAAKALQIDEKNKSRAIERGHNPPLQGPAHNGINLTPGSYNAITGQMASGAGSKIESIYSFTPNIEGLLLNIDKREQRLRRAFFVDLFLMLTLDERNQRATAEEIRAKYDEKVLALGPTLEQANAMLRVLHTRVFGIMARKSAPIWAGVIDGEPILPKPPRELEGIDIEPQFVSALQQAQRAQALQGIERFASFAGSMAEFLGGPPEKFDADQALDEYGAALGIPPEIVRDDEEVAAMREAKAQAAQAEQMAQMAPAANQMASAVKSLAETRPVEGGIMDRLAGTV